MKNQAFNLDPKVWRECVLASTKDIAEIPGDRLEVYMAALVMLLGMRQLDREIFQGACDFVESCIHDSEETFIEKNKMAYQITKAIMSKNHAAA